MTRGDTPVGAESAADAAWEAIVSSSQTELMAARAHRLYVFGVIFSALFLAGFVLTAMIASDLRKSTASTALGQRSAVDTAKPLANASPAELVDPAAGERQQALDQIRAAEKDVRRTGEQLKTAETALFRFLYDQFADAATPAAARQNAAAVAPS